MSLKPRIICLIVLCSFTFTTSAANFLCNLSMHKDTEHKQHQMDTIDDSCHNDKDQTSDETIKNCCHDMTSCNASTSIVANTALAQIQIIHSSVQLSANEQDVFHSSSPPTPPPKLI